MMADNPLDAFIQGFAQFIGAFTKNCVAAFDAFPTRLLNASFRPFIRKCKQNATVHWRWERCCCPPVFNTAPVYPRYLYEEIHGLTGYDEVYPHEMSDLERSIKALADAFRSGAITLGDEQPRRIPEFFINH